MNEPVFFYGCTDTLFEVIRANELLIKVKRDRKARRHGNGCPLRVDNLSEIGRLRSEANGVARTLVFQISKPVILQVCARRNKVGALYPFTVAGFYFAGVCGRE